MQLVYQKSIYEINDSISFEIDGSEYVADVDGELEVEKTSTGEIELTPKFNSVMIWPESDNPKYDPDDLSDLINSNKYDLIKIFVESSNNFMLYIDENKLNELIKGE